MKRSSELWLSELCREKLTAELTAGSPLKAAQGVGSFDLLRYSQQLTTAHNSAPLDHIPRYKVYLVTVPRTALPSRRRTRSMPMLARYGC